MVADASTFVDPAARAEVEAADLTCSCAGMLNGNQRVRHSATECVEVAPAACDYCECPSAAAPVKRTVRIGYKTQRAPCRCACHPVAPPAVVPNGEKAPKLRTSPRYARGLVAPSTAPVPLPKMPDLFRSPGLVLADELAAEQRAGKKRATVAAKVLRLLVKASGHGFTVDEIEVGLRLAHQQVSPRVLDLYRAGLVLLTGRKRKTRTGHEADVYVAAPNALARFAKGGA